MEYTNDVIFNVKYQNESSNTTIVKHPRFHKILEKMDRDNYLILTIIISIIILFIDYLIIKRFIEIVSLLQIN